MNNIIYQKNLDKISIKDSMLYDAIIEYYENKDSESEEYSYEIKYAKNESPILVIHNDDKEWRMNSLYNPEAEAKKWASQYSTTAIETTTSVFGLGNGYFIRELIKTIDESSLLIVFEPNKECFNYIIENFDISDILESKNVLLIVKDYNDINKSGIYGLCLDWVKLENHVMFAIPNYMEAFEKEYREYCSFIKSTLVNTVINEKTITSLSDSILNNTLWWLKNNKNEYYLSDIIEEIPEGLTGIVVAAGPSLEKNIEELRKAKGKSLIICVNTALPFMAKKEVIPDMAIVIDPIVKRDHFASDLGRNLPLLHDLSASEEAVSENVGKKITVASSGYSYQTNLLRKIGKESSLYEAGGSVATSAFSIMRSLGVKTIILVGQDLAFGKDGNTHAFGVNDGDKSSVEMIEGIDGEMVQTRGDWKFFLDWYENAIPLLHRDGIEVIDATEGGAKIHGSVIMKLKDAVDKYCNIEFNIDEVINKLNNADTYKKVIECVEEDMEDLDIINKRVKKAIQSCERLINACNKNTIFKKCYDKDIEVLRKTNLMFEKKRVYGLVEMIDVQEENSVLSGIYSFGENDKDNMIVTYEKTLDMYKIIEKASEKLINRFKELNITPE